MSSVTSERSFISFLSQSAGAHSGRPPLGDGGHGDHRAPLRWVRRPRCRAEESENHSQRTPRSSATGATPAAVPVPFLLNLLTPHPLPTQLAPTTNHRKCSCHFSLWSRWQPRSLLAPAFQVPPTPTPSTTHHLRPLLRPGWTVLPTRSPTLLPRRRTLCFPLHGITQGLFPAKTGNTTPERNSSSPHLLLSPSPPLPASPPPHNHQKVACAQSSRRLNWRGRPCPI